MQTFLIKKAPGVHGSVNFMFVSLQKRFISSCRGATKKADSNTAGSATGENGRGFRGARDNFN